MHYYNSDKGLLILDGWIKSVGGLFGMRSGDGDDHSGGRNAQKRPPDRCSYCKYVSQNSEPLSCIMGKQHCDYKTLYQGRDYCNYNRDFIKDVYQRCPNPPAKTFWCSHPGLQKVIYDEYLAARNCIYGESI